MNKVCKFIADIFFPNRCPMCDGFIKYDSLLCEKCKAEIEFIISPYCEKCGKENCCCDEKRYYDNSYSIAYYSGGVKHGILNLKINNGVNFAEYMAVKAIEILKKKSDVQGIDIITAVPMSKRSATTRGYNQAYVFAKLLSGYLKKPCSDKLLKKSNDRLVQHKLNRVERKEQVKGAFLLCDNSPQIKGKTILLCDDVITTGSTLNECSRVLKEAGAKKIICITIASTRFTDK